MLRRLLTLLTILTLACASAHAYVPERSLLQAGELASPAKTAPRGFAARAELAAKEKSPASDCCIREDWHPPLKLASSMQFTGHYREREGSAYYAQQRYYRPGLGRFNRVDPWEGNETNPITLNKYLYANGNPLLYVDPDGRASYLSDWEAYTDDTVDRYRQDIDRAAAEGAAARAFALGVGKGFASLGNLVVGGLNTTSNLLARSLYDGSTYEQAQRELESDIFAMSQAIEAAHTVAAVVQEDPSGAVVAVHGAAVGFTADLMARDPRAMAGLGEFTGQLVVPGAGAKSLKLTGEALDVARAAMRMGDGFLDVGMDDLDAAYVSGPGRSRTCLAKSSGWVDCQRFSA